MFDALDSLISCRDFATPSKSKNPPQCSSSWGDGRRQELAALFKHLLQFAHRWEVANSRWNVYLRCLFCVPLLLATNIESAMANQNVFPLFDERRELADVQFYDESGELHRLSQWRGKVVVLNIWATWCPPCRTEMPTLDRLKAFLGSKSFDVVALSIDQAGVDIAKAFFDEIDVQHLSLYIDSTLQVANDLKVKGMPTTILIDPDGYELGRFLGDTDWDSPEMIRFFESVLRDHAARL